MKMERQRSRKAELDSLHVSTFDLFDDATQIPIRKDFQKTRTLGVKPFPEALLPSAYTRKHRPFSKRSATNLCDCKRFGHPFRSSFSNL